MKTPTPQPPYNRRHRGAASLVWIVLAALFALAVAAVVYLAVTGGGAQRTAPPPPATQEAIDLELGVLQQGFQTAMREEQDLGRIAAKARAFTEQYPDQQAGYILLAQTRMGLGQWDRAYAAWQKSLTFEDNAFELCKMAGLCAAKLGQIDQALVHYQQAVAATHDQADSEVYAALGRLYLALEDTDNAQQQFTRSVEARGPGAETNYKHEGYAGLADVASVRGQLDEAIELVDRAIKMSNLDSDSDSAAYHIQKARIYMDAGRDDDAVTMLSYTWSQFSESPWRIESARLRAKLYERAGALDKAVDHLQSATQYHQLNEKRHTPTLANFTALLADWQIKAGRTDAADISLHNLQTLMPEHPAVAELQAKLR